jgi:hypothetical protein
LGIGLLASGGAFPTRDEVLDAEGHGESLAGLDMKPYLHQKFTLRTTQG